MVGDLPELGVEMNHRARRAADDGAVGIRASCGFDAFALALAVEETREDRLLENGGRVFLEGVKEWTEVTDVVALEGRCLAKAIAKLQVLCNEELSDGQ